jgi:cardiolipin synthase
MHMIPWVDALLVVEWVIRIVTVVYVPQRRSPAAARTWLLLILLLPIPGVVAYAMFGHIAMPRSRAKLYARVAKRLSQAKQQRRDAEPVPAATPPAFETVARLAEALGDFPPVCGNSVALLPGYQAAIDRLVADIDAARHHVHLLFYIVAPDRVGLQVMDAVIRAAGRGVTCRVVMDAVGSRWGLRVLGPRLAAAGVEVTESLPVGLLRTKAARFDLRNHRKLAVIDGAIGWSGSQNLVTEVLHDDVVHEELMVRFTGPAVASLQVVFLADRYVEIEHSVPSAGLFPPQSCEGGTVVQVLPSGPAYGHANFKQVAQALINGARRRVFVTTPYFIPDAAFLECLQMAASRGVEVSLLVSRHGDIRIASWAQQSFYEELLEDGIRIHIYEPAFLHAKHLSIDDQAVVIGSSNLDIRSFWLNNEISLVIYDEAVAKDLRAIEEGYLQRCTELTEADWAKRSLPRKIGHNLGRLADSLL